LASIAKLIAKVRNNPKDVRFDEACRVAEYLGFTGKGGQGRSQLVLQARRARGGLNFQKRAGGKIKPYQARQLKKLIERYLGSESTGEDVVTGANEVTGTNDDEETP